LLEKVKKLILSQSFLDEAKQRAEPPYDIPLDIPLGPLKLQIYRQDVPKTLAIYTIRTGVRRLGCHAVGDE